MVNNGCGELTIDEAVPLRRSSLASVPNEPIAPSSTEMQQFGADSMDWTTVGYVVDDELSLGAARTVLLPSLHNPVRCHLKPVRLTSNHKHCSSFITTTSADTLCSVPMAPSDYAWTENAAGLDAARQREKHEQRAAALQRWWSGIEDEDAMEDEAEPSGLDLTMRGTASPLQVHTHGKHSTDLPAEELSPTSIDAWPLHHKERKERPSGDTVIDLLS